MLEFLQIITILSCGLFTGAAVYINLVEHPARMECGTELAATVFGPSYRRAAVIQISLAVISFIGSALTYLESANILWMVGGLIIVSVIPFTLIAIMPTNKKLLSPSLDTAVESTEELLSRWGKLHAVRSVLGVLALLIFLTLVTFD
jgi:uncharacterized membrane protein